MLRALHIHQNNDHKEKGHLMKRPMLSFGLLAAVALVPAAPALAKVQAPRCATIDNARVTAMFGDFSRAWATKDPVRVTKLFAKDAVLLATVSNAPRTTPAAIEDYFVSFLKKSPVGTIDTSTIKLGCNMATRVGTWTVKLTDPATGEASDVKARYTFIYKPEGDVWKIDHLHSSMMPEKL
jgi:uncharacterized protein (TIGR02246 family)